MVKWEGNQSDNKGYVESEVWIIGERDAPKHAPGFSQLVQAPKDSRTFQNIPGCESVRTWGKEGLPLCGNFK
jgi:hypothetical protein